MNSPYRQAVVSRFHLYNSLFLNLPFDSIYQTGTLLPLLQQAAKEGFENEQSPTDIMHQFFADYVPHLSPDERLNLLFNFIKFTERQVVLFDSIEDATYEIINPTKGKGTLPALLIRATEDNKLKKLKQKVDELKIHIVLTAHPTQFYPGPVLGIINDLDSAIRENKLEDIQALLLQLGKTGFINKQKPTPLDEAVSLTWYVQNVFYETIPTILYELIKNIKADYATWKNFDLITLGFWPGGDRDGNPFVTHQTTLDTATHLQTTVLRSYHQDVRKLRRRLTFRLVEDKVLAVENKLKESIYFQKKTYTKPEELLAELEEIRHLLLTQHEGLFVDMLDKLLIKVRVFGFHLASLDIRQDSSKHAHVWKTIREKVNAPLAVLQNPKDFLAWEFNPNAYSFNDDLVAETFRTLDAVRTIQKQNGERGCHRYIISNCGSVMDILYVYRLAELSWKNVSLDIVPLFETIDDLREGVAIMKTLFRIDKYKQHLAHRKNKQYIMLGFSDGTKDGGYVKANWSIYTAKEELTLLARQLNIDVVFFDGRGGPPARGGGNTHDFYASLGPTISDKEVQITIQGQTISSNFGTVASCQYNIEQLLSAGVENAVFESVKPYSTAEKKVMNQLADEAYKAYIQLRRHPKFTDYLEKATPLTFFADSNIGSRPAKRQSTSKLRLEDLRAIPFVGSWAMMKQNVPGFYGIGSALLNMKKAGRWNDIKKLYVRSLFFRTLLNNSIMALSKSYFPATAYMKDDKEFGAFWKKLHSEYQRTCALLPEVAGYNSLYEQAQSNRESIELREQIILPSVLIQQYALQQIRLPKNKKQHAVWRKLIIRCMFGIINAARNSA